VNNLNEQEIKNCINFFFDRLDTTLNKYKSTPLNQTTKTFINKAFSSQFDRFYKTTTDINGRLKLIEELPAILKLLKKEGH
jgi:hypothetical protein